MFTYKTLAITNRHLCREDFLLRIEKLCKTNTEAIILREKDMSEDEYTVLAEKVLKICNKYNKTCILHTFIDTAIKLNCPNIHLPLHLLEKYKDKLSSFKIIGSSVHSSAEAEEAEKLGATYITAGHIFKTDCKIDLAPRGLQFVKDVASSVSIPVYGLGGIHKNNEKSAIDSGCTGIAIMSEAMTP